MSSKRPEINQAYLDAFRRNTNAIRGIFTYKKELWNVFGKIGLESLERTFKLITNHMNLLAKDQEVKVSGQERQSVTRALNTLKQVAISKPMPTIYIDLTKELIKLINNWNRNTIQAGDLSRDIVLIDRIITAKTTLDESIKILRHILDRLKKVSEYTPPAIELSKHYLKILEETEKEEVVEKTT